MKRILIRNALADNRGNWYAANRTYEVEDDFADELIANGSAVLELEHILAQLEPYDFEGFMLTATTPKSFKALVETKGYKTQAARKPRATKADAK